MVRRIAFFFCKAGLAYNERCIIVHRPTTVADILCIHFEAFQCCGTADNDYPCTFQIVIFFLSFSLILFLSLGFNCTHRSHSKTLVWPAKPCRFGCCRRRRTQYARSENWPFSGYGQAAEADTPLCLRFDLGNRIVCRSPFIFLRSIHNVLSCIAREIVRVFV